MIVPAIVYYIVASVALIALEQRLIRVSAVDPGIEWLNDHVYTPLARTLVVLGFVALAYPALFGLSSAPPLPQLLRDGRIDVAITAAFAASLVLPLVPLVDRLPGAVLAAQGILACCLLAGWVGDHLGIEVSLWAGWINLLSIVAILIIGKSIARLIVKFYVPRDRERFEIAVEEATRLTSEIPAIALYAYALGQNLSV